MRIRRGPTNRTWNKLIEYGDDILKSRDYRVEIID